jgi:hypothetical protein
MARVVLPIAGAAVGFMVGGPTGAMIGWNLGSVAGGIVDPQVIQGPRIGEIPQQTAQEGGPRPIIYGDGSPIPGNIIFAGGPRIVRKKKKSGKGGGPKVKTESIFRTYAIGICEGPVTGIRRVWRNGTLVYDASENPQLSKLENNNFLQRARFFLGTYTQNPSPDLEAVLSPAPAMRGTCYMVMADEDLTDARGMIPQWSFQIGNAEYIPPPLVPEWHTIFPALSFNQNEPNDWVETDNAAGMLGVMWAVNGHDVSGNAAPWNAFGFGKQPGGYTSTESTLNALKVFTLNPWWGHASAVFYRANGAMNNVRPLSVGSYFSIAYTGRRFMKNVDPGTPAAPTLITGPLNPTNNTTAFFTVAGLTVPPQGGAVFLLFAHGLISEAGKRAFLVDPTGWNSVDQWQPSVAPMPVGAFWWKYFPPPGGPTGDIVVGVSIDYAHLYKRGQLFCVPALVPT